MALSLTVLSVYYLSITHLFLPTWTLILLLRNAVKMSVTQINAASLMLSKSEASDRSIQNNVLFSEGEKQSLHSQISKEDTVECELPGDRMWYLLDVC